MMDNKSIISILTNHTNFDVHYLEYMEFLDESVPVVAFLSFLSIIGTFGNFHALLVYSLRYTPSNHRTFVVWLAAVDFVACFISIPFEIFDSRYDYTFTSTGTCKLFRFVNHTVIIASGGLLAVIAMERFRKACQPFQRQLDIRGAKLACILTVLISGVISVPAFILYGSAPKEFKEVPGMYGYDCRVLGKFKKTIYVKIYNILLLSLTTIAFVLCVVLYSFVGRKLYTQMKFRRLSTSIKRRPSNFSVKENSSEEESSVHQFKRHTMLRSLSSSSTGKISSMTRSGGKLDRTKRITLMFLVATAVSYIGYMPNSIILLIQAVKPKTYRRVANSLGSFTYILLRIYFLNNVTNPIVYCFIDNRFRRECKQLYRKLKFW